MPQSAAPLAGRGRVHLAAGRPHAAIRDFTRAVTADPRFAAAYRNRAEAKFDIMRLPDAIEDLSRAIAFDANNPELYLLRGQAYLASDNVAAAMKDFTHVTTLDPRSARGFAARGLANGITQTYEEAFADLNRAIELDPRSGARLRLPRRRLQAERSDGCRRQGRRDGREARSRRRRGAVGQGRDRGGAGAHRAGDRRLQEGRRFAAAPEAGGRRPAAARRRYRQRSRIARSREPASTLGASCSRAAASTPSAISSAACAFRWRWPATGQPRLLEWEAKKPPLGGIATLRFTGGVVPGAMGPEEVEQVAILDLDNNSVIGIEPHREGKKVATWTWQDDRVVVASVDGATDEFILRAGRQRDADPRRYTSTDSGGGWMPWGQLDSRPRKIGARAGGSPRRSSSCSSTRRRGAAAELHGERETRPGGGMAIWQLQPSLPWWEAGGRVATAPPTR